MNMIHRTKNAVVLAASVALMSSTGLFAETTLRATGGQFELVGELLDVTEEAYTISTELGELIVRREFVTCEGDGCPGTEVVEEEVNKTVRLSSADGSIELVGELMDITPTSYVVDTAMGTLTVRSEFVSCEGPACPASLVKSDRVGISVAGQVTADLMTAILDEYSSSKDFSVSQQIASNDAREFLIGNTSGEEVAKIDVVKSETESALAGLVSGETVMAVTWDRISPEMLGRALGRTVNATSDYLDESVIGLDAVSLSVNSRNVADVVGINAIQGVLTGNITNWSQLGGNDAPISIHLLESNGELHRQLAARNIADGALEARALLHPNANSLRLAVEADVNAMGVLYRSQAESLKSLTVVSACNIFSDGSDFSIQTEEYPLTLRLYVYTMKNSEMSEFIQNVDQFMATDFGQATLAERGLVTQALQIKPMQVQGARVLSSVLYGEADNAWQNVTKRYFTEASTARRISTALRFALGGADLDAKSLEDIERITEIVRANEYAGYQVLVFGFSDSTGVFGNNITLSQRRADTVATILRENSRGYLEDGSVLSFGMGPIAPIGCNTTAEGRELNRRVEVWLRPRA